MSKYPKRSPVTMPVEPPYEVLMFLAGDPLILAASDEGLNRKWYARFRERMKEAQAAQEKRK